MEIALSVVADGRRAALEGLPALLDLFASRGVVATIFVNAGAPGRDVIPPLLAPPPPPPPGFLAKLLGADRPPAIDRSPLGPELAPLLERARSDGHEIGFRPLDPDAWEGTLAAGADAVRAAVEAGERAVGGDDATRLPFAAPRWRVSPDLLRLEDDGQFPWASDTRGTAPFVAAVEGRHSRVVQVPTTLPSWDEVLGSPGLDDLSLLAFYRSSVREGIAQVHRLHAEIEGISHLPLFTALLDGWREDRVRFVTLGTVARRAISRKETLKIRPVRDREVPGRAAPVACEG